jgi:hypothetical protein
MLMKRGLRSPASYPKGPQASRSCPKVLAGATFSDYIGLKG